MGQGCKYVRRFLSLLLAMAMLCPLGLEGLAAELPEEDAAVQTEMQTDMPDEPDGEETASGDPQTPAEEDTVTPEEPTDDGSTDPEEPSGDDSTDPEEPAGDSPADPEEPAGGEASDAGAGETDPAPETPEESSDAQVQELQWTETSLSLQYDDRYSFAGAWPGYEVLEFSSQTVTSWQVSRGSVSSARDKAVLALQTSSQTDVIATGTGQATVILAPKGRADEARAALEAEETQPAETASETSAAGPLSLVRVEVTVTAAPLTVMLLLGQSNMEGYRSDLTGSHPEDSILCPDGEVYCDAVLSSAVNRYVSGGLTGNRSLNGREITTDRLTSAGSGKTGADSALAYEWNRLTGDKVWVVNAAIGGSSIATWASGGSSYERMQDTAAALLQTLTAEVQAGHYTESHRLTFWLQGERDWVRTATEYLADFRSFYDGLDDIFGMERFGIIMPRASVDTNCGEDDIRMTGPRIAQYYIGMSTQYPNVYVVSNINEQWVTDGGVRSYFRSAYPGGRLTYPLRSGSNLSGLPATVAEVHPDLHYAQVGHNENGLDAARSMYALVYGEGSARVSVSWRNMDGRQVSSLQFHQKGSVVVVPSVTPVYRSKGLSISTTNVSYQASTGVLRRTSSQSGTLRAAAGSTSAPLKVTGVSTSTPALLSAQNAVGGVSLRWSEVAGATVYRVYRKYNLRSWEAIADVKGTSYLDTDAWSSTTYTYTVRAFVGSALSPYDASGISVHYLSTPALLISNVDGGIQVKWNESCGAEQYIVYRRMGSSWERIAAVDSGSQVTYVDQTVRAGQQVTYTVRAACGNVLSSFRQAGVTTTYLPMPGLTGASNVSTGVRVTWSRSSGAAGYYVYRKSTGNWQRVAVIRNSATTSYTDTTAVSGTDYRYTVRAVSGSVLSGYSSSGIAIRYLQTPTLTQLETVESGGSATGLRIYWRAVSGASNYRVYRRLPGGSWTRVGQTSGTNYTDTTARSGQAYSYTVRAQSASGMSFYDTAGLTATWLTMPVVQKAANVSGGVRVTWSASSGSLSGYWIYRKEAGKGWQKVGTVSSSQTSYTDTGVTSGKTYYYTVRAYRGASVSSYDHTGRQVVCLAVPALRSAAKSGRSICVTWDVVSGATSYTLYRRTGSGSWVAIATLTGNGTTSCIDANVTSGHTYTYTVRARCSGGLSDYSRTGVRVRA